MDYPVSDESAKLHNGKFTDGDNLAGIPASRDSAEYQNMVFDEIINVITAGGLTPDENSTTQLKEAIDSKLQDVGKYNLVVFDASGTYSKPENLKNVKVTVIGGGGGGGGCTLSESASGGAGGGASIKIIAASLLSSTETITIGAGGAGGSSGLVAGLTGGSSSFGVHCSATGGYGGNVNNGLDAGSHGGMGYGGDLNIGGDAGGASGVDHTSVAGKGGNSFMGGGGRVNVNSSAGAGRNYGGGGAGANGNGSPRAGGNGATGVVIIEEFF